MSGYTPRRTVFTPVSTHRIHGVAKKGAAEAQNQAQQKDAKGGSEWHEWTTNPEGTEGSAVPCETRLVAAKGQSGGGGIRTLGDLRHAGFQVWCWVEPPRNQLKMGRFFWATETETG